MLDPSTENRVVSVDGLTLTAIMYAMVANVVSPARSSVEKLASAISFGWKKQSRWLANGLD